VVSAFERRDYIDEVQRSGFLGYVVKAAPIAEFQTAVRDVLEGRAAFPPREPGTRSSAVRLTRRQVQLLDLIRLGLSSKEIALKLHIAEGTVNNHVASILQIFDAASRAQAVSRAIELGLIATPTQYKGLNAPLVICTAKRPSRTGLYESTKSKENQP
jgi:DNA-binding NarL/FixJ family response regulator